MAVLLEEEQVDPVHFDPEPTTGRPHPRAAMPLPGRKIPDRWEEAAVAAGVVVGSL